MARYMKGRWTHGVDRPGSGLKSLLPALGFFLGFLASPLRKVKGSQYIFWGKRIFFLGRAKKANPGCSVFFHGDWGFGQDRPKGMVSLLFPPPPRGHQKKVPYRETLCPHSLGLGLVIQFPWLLHDRYWVGSLDFKSLVEAKGRPLTLQKG